MDGRGPHTKSESASREAANKSQLETVGVWSMVVAAEMKMNSIGSKKVESVDLGDGLGMGRKENELPKVKWEEQRKHPVGLVGAGFHIIVNLASWVVGDSIYQDREQRRKQGGG